MALDAEISVGLSETTCCEAPRTREARTKRRLIVLAAIAAVFSVALAISRWMPPLFGHTICTELSITRLTINGSLKTSLDMFRANMRRYPTGKEGLSALIDAPLAAEDRARWTGPYVDDPEKLKDTWGHELKYVEPGQHNPGAYDLSSAGPDGQFGTSDDITNWTMP